MNLKLILVKINQPFLSQSKDKDRDGVGDKCDNCWEQRKNPAQEDDDWNGVGDVCDEGADFDGDGIVDSVDLCPKFSDASQNSKIICSLYFLFVMF